MKWNFGISQVAIFRFFFMFDDFFTPAQKVGKTADCAGGRGVVAKLPLRLHSQRGQWSQFDLYSTTFETASTEHNVHKAPGGEQSLRHYGGWERNLRNRKMKRANVKGEGR
jgi:hypothetical protein